MTVAVQLLGHFLLLSLLATGGAITLAPEMYRYMVLETGLLTDVQFTSSIAIAQAAPGPNILFVTVMGWQAAGWLGALAATIGILVPSATLVMLMHRFSRARSDALWVKAVKEGLAPVVIALLLATSWILSEHWADQWHVLALVLATALITTFTRIPPVLLIAAGAALGAIGFV